MQSDSGAPEITVNILAYSMYNLCCAAMAQQICANGLQ